MQWHESSKGTLEITSQFEVTRRPRKAPRHSRLYRRFHCERRDVARSVDACLGTRDFSNRPPGGSNDQPVKPGPLRGSDTIASDRSAMRCQPDPGRRHSQSSPGGSRRRSCALGGGASACATSHFWRLWLVKSSTLPKKGALPLGDYVSFRYVSRTS